ncbi:hypothetical protein ACLOJK_012948 [Asimina triloba]
MSAELCRLRSGPSSGLDPIDISSCWVAATSGWKTLRVFPSLLSQPRSRKLEISLRRLLWNSVDLQPSEIKVKCEIAGFWIRGCWSLELGLMGFGDELGDMLGHALASFWRSHFRPSPLVFVGSSILPEAIPAGQLPNLVIGQSLDGYRMHGGRCLGIINMDLDLFLHYLSSMARTTSWDEDASRLHGVVSQTSAWVIWAS